LFQFDTANGIRKKLAQSELRVWRSVVMMTMTSKLSNLAGFATTVAQGVSHSLMLEYSLFLSLSRVSIVNSKNMPAAGTGSFDGDDDDDDE
jgi:hypothetical protein